MTFDLLITNKQTIFTVLFWIEHLDRHILAGRDFGIISKGHCSKVLTKYRIVRRGGNS